MTLVKFCDTILSSGKKSTLTSSLASTSVGVIMKVSKPKKGYKSKFSLLRLTKKIPFPFKLAPSNLEVVEWFPLMVRSAIVKVIDKTCFSREREGVLALTLLRPEMVAFPTMLVLEKKLLDGKKLARNVNGGKIYFESFPMDPKVMFKFSIFTVSGTPRRKSKSSTSKKPKGPGALTASIDCFAPLEGTAQVQAEVQIEI